MNKLNIGLIGYGHLGRALHKRAKEVDLRLDISEGRGHNKSLSSRSDLILLAVKPIDVRGVIGEIRADLEGKELISFAAAVPRAAIEEWGATAAKRAMTDIGLNQVIAQRGGHALDLLQRLSRRELLEAETDVDIDRFTALIGCLPGVAAWYFTHERASAEKTLHAYSDWAHEHFGISKQVMQGIILDVSQIDDHQQLLRSVATTGGVTEAMVQCLQDDSRASFETLLSTGMDRIESLAKQLA